MAREETSVLDRELFRPKSRGIEELPESEDNGDLKARQEQALAMIEAAKQKFDPANFQTLSEQSRPGVFRPAAVNMPAQQQTATTAQRMQQMSQMGMRPVGMAKGGLALEGYSPYEMSQFLAERGAANLDSVKRDYDLPSYNEENISPTISSEGTDTSLDRIRALRARIRDIGDMPVVSPTAETRGIKDLAPFPDSTSEISYEGGPMANDYGNVSVAKTRAGRAVQELLGKNQPLEENKYAGLNLDDPTLWTDEQIDMVSKRFPGNEEGTASALRAERQMARETKGGPRAEEIQKNLLRQSEERKKIEEEAPVPGLFDESTPLQVEEARAAQAAAAERHRKAAEEAGTIPVPRQEAPLGVTAEAPVQTSSAPEGVAGLIGGGRGQTVERPGERAAYLKSYAEGNLPSTATPPATKGGAGGAGAGTDKDHPTSLYDIKRDREDAFNMALMQAGLAMMAGKSSNALANIGEGGLAGLQAYANQLGQSRARALEERKLNMMESYYGSREKALEAAGVRHMDAMNRIKLDAMKAADAAVATELKANPTMAKRDADLLRQQTYDRYMGAIANNAEYTSSAPELNPEATSILGD